MVIEGASRMVGVFCVSALYASGVYAQTPSIEGKRTPDEDTQQLRYELEDLLKSNPEIVFDLMIQNSGKVFGSL
jgi:hypothetical protein